MGSNASIKFALPYKNMEAPTTRNVVFKEVLSSSSQQIPCELPYSNSSQQIPCELEFPDHDYFPGDLDDRDGVYDIDTSNNMENVNPAARSRYRFPTTTQKRSCSPAKNIAPVPETTPRLPVVSAQPQCDYERIRIQNIEERQELWNSLNHIELETINAGGEINWADLLNRNRRKKEFKEQVLKFISTKKEGWGTQVFKLEEFKTYILSTNSTFSQVLLL